MANGESYMNKKGETEDFQFIYSEDSAGHLKRISKDNLRNKIGLSPEYLEMLNSKVDGAFVEGGYLYLTSNDQVVVGPLGPFSGTGGGSDNGAKLTLTNTSGWLTKTISHGSECWITANWSSLEDDIATGNGILKITVNNAVKATKDVKQGDISIDVGSYLAAGSNTVKLSVSDVYGNSRTINYGISAISLSISSGFDDTSAYNGAIAYTYTPVGDVSKLVHFIMDGLEIGTATVETSGRQQTFNIPAQSHGNHVFEVYFEAEVDGTKVESNKLYHDLICITDDGTDTIIASNFNVSEIQQYAAVSIPYSVYTPNALTSAVKIYENDTMIQDITVDRTRQTLSYRADETGELVLKIVSGGKTKTFNLTVTESDISLDAETNDLALYLNSYGRSNNEANPGVWTFGDIAAVFTNFNYQSDGWKQDVNGATVLRVSGDARLEIPYQIFAKDFRTTGKTIEVLFAAREVIDYEAVIMSCISGDRGFWITSKNAILKSEQSQINAQFKEEEIVRMSFVIEKKSDNRLIQIYVNGIMSGCIQYPDDDDFSQTSPVNISIGSNDCTMDIYSIRVYDNNLTRYQILDNWIADIPDLDDKIAAYTHNDIYDAYGAIVIDKLPKDLPYLVLEASELPQFKGDKKTCSGYYVDPVNPSKSFRFTNASIDVQGTSSQYYYVKNYKIKFQGGFILTDGTTVAVYQMNNNAVPTNVFTMKADVASSEGANNVVLAQLYNELCPVDTPPQEEDPRVRQTIDGHPIVIFWDKGDGAKFVGKYNFNNDKGTEEVFGFSEGDESWEILQNGTDRVGFKSADFSGDDWKNDFEARYPEDNVDVTNLSALSRWLVSTDPEQATYSTLEEPVTYDEVEYDIDTPEYRLAKYKNELPEHASVDALVFYYVFTETFLCIDQREKNAFPTLFDALKLWMVLFYDADSSLGTDNKGNLAFDFFLEDIDYTEAGDPVFNGQNSVLWSNLRKTFYDKIQAEYTRLRTELRTDGSGQPLLSYDVVDAMFENHQDKWPEAVFNEDAYKKCLEPLIKAGDGLYLPMLQGKKEQHRKWWLYNRFRYLDSKYATGTSMTNRITIRAHAKNNVFLTSFVNMYGHVYYNAEMVEHRMVPGVEYEFEWAATGAEDAVIGINDADMLTSLGDLSSLMVELIDVSKATHLTHLKVGDASEGYVNNNLVSVTHGNNTLLRTVDYRNCQSLAMTVDMSGCTNIEEVYFDGTSITGLSLPNGGILKVLHLPGTVTNLTIRNQKKITDFTMPSYANITTLRLENVSEVIDMKTILNAIAANSRVRLIGFNWEAESVDEIRTLFDKLDTMRGLDENGNNLDKAVAGGTIHIDAITGAELAELQSRYATVNITYDHITSYIYYYNFDGSELVHTEAVYDGGDGVYTGTVSRPSTAQYNYTFAGWSKEKDSTTADADALKNVTADRNVYAAYTATVRTYSVYFYNDTELLQTVENVPYGGSATYIGDDPVNNTTGNPDDFEFKGWSPSPTNIKGDTYCYAIYLDKREITDSWAAIVTACNDGTAATKYSVGAFKMLDFGIIDAPYSVSGRSAVVCNEELYLVGSANTSGSKKFYKWDGTSWINMGTLPHGYGDGNIVALNNEIHILGSYDYGKETRHYKWDGTSWTSVSTLPYAFEYGGAVVYNNEIHILGRYNTSSTDAYSTSHYKWNGTEWVSVSTLPYTFNCGVAVVYNDEIHILGSYNSTCRKYHYKWNGTEWVEVSTLPHKYVAYNTAAIVYNNELYIIGANESASYHIDKFYKWNGEEWTHVSELPVYFDNNPVVVYENKIHVFKSTSHYTWNGEKWSYNGVYESIPMQIAGINHDAYPEGVYKWESLGSLPYPIEDSPAVIFNNEIHVFGSGYSSSYKKNHYKWNGTSWISASTLPYEFDYGGVVVYNDEINILGSNYSSNGTLHYKWNGVEWISVSTLPYDFKRSKALVWNNEIHILGSTAENCEKFHYKYDDTNNEWISVSTLPYEFYRGEAVIYNDEIHLIGGTGNTQEHYKYEKNTSSWKSVGNLPYRFNSSCAVVFNNEIHILGAYDSSYRKSHYKFDGTNWTEIQSLPYNFYSGSAVIYNDVITIMGGGESFTTRNSFMKLNMDHPKATLTFIAKNVLKEPRPYVAGGSKCWSESDLRTYLNGDEFIASLPSVLQTAIKTVDKLSIPSYDSQELIASQDKVWIPSLNELGIFGAFESVDGMGEQYDIFSDYVSRKRSTVEDESMYQTYWTRTDMNHLFDIYAIDEHGYESSESKNGTEYVLIGFCL